MAARRWAEAHRSRRHRSAKSASPSTPTALSGSGSTPLWSACTVGHALTGKTQKNADLGLFAVYCRSSHARAPAFVRKASAMSASANNPEPPPEGGACDQKAALQPIASAYSTDPFQNSVQESKEEVAFTADARLLDESAEGLAPALGDGGGTAGVQELSAETPPPPPPPPSQWRGHQRCRHQMLWPLAARALTVLPCRYCRQRLLRQMTAATAATKTIH